ncbi:hypothetical protein L1787_18245 [Acuticoccus sp. M5D2P5]|uniref:hypothetical protein n=1 Tax=Acuticoccus kalidii TaxID=2910977 RepID=UPI001F36376A|nr:hypothetical protein [Acuticoccus kalidii]MCF3935339.1 hypothetical protein [Acuticoccus kalidii]
MSRLLWLISLPFRILGYVIVIAALVAGFRDLYQSVDRDTLVLTPFGDLWYLAWPASLDTVHTRIVAMEPGFWDTAIEVILRLPAWLALFIIATLILLIAQLIYRPR